MTLEEHIDAIEEDDLSHRARILLLLLAYRDLGKAGPIDLTRIAYLDYFMRFPASLERVLNVRGKSTSRLIIERFERTSIEAQYGALRVAPWDAEYRRWIAAEFAADRIVAQLDKDNDFTIRLTDQGVYAANKLREAELFSVMYNRATVITRNLNLKTRRLRQIIETALPETVTLRWSAIQ